MANGNGKSSRDWGIITKRDREGTETYYARIIRIDGSGRKRQYTAKADNKTHAKQLRDDLERKHNTNGESAIHGDKVRFRELADLYESRKLIPAEYHGAGRSRRKVAGVRSLGPSRHYLSVLKEHFGSRLIRNITHSEIEDFKSKRLKEKSLRGERSIADVNRTLELLRAVLRFAFRNGWIVRTPFEMGSPLISKADETKRERILTFEEESRLLAACDAERKIRYMRAGQPICAHRRKGRTHLKALIIVAVDTSMRKGELLKLVWSDVDFALKTISVQALNSKTSRERVIGMTPRVVDQMKALWNDSPKDDNLLVFGIRDNFKTAFMNALEEAEVQDFRFHDLRHTAITRMVGAGLPAMEIMKVSGHTQWTTFARYVNPGHQAVRHIADALSRHNSLQAVRASVRRKKREIDE